MEETSHNSNNNHLVMKIKSKYILAKVFEYLQQKKGLKIIQYNKNCQKKIGKRLIDYKREYSKIIIEIIRCQDEEGEFINIDKKNERYYHIYFNDEEKEVKKTEITRYDNVKKIKIIIDYEIKSLNNLFMNCDCIKKINFIK